MPINFERIAFGLPDHERLQKAERCERTVQRMLDQTSLSVDDLWRLITIGVDGAAWRCSVDPGSASIRESLRAAASGAAALYALAASEPGREIEVLFPNGDRKLTSTGWTDLADSIGWSRGFFAAMASRSHEALEILANVPMDLLRRSTTKAPDWLYLYYEAFAAFARREADAPDREVAALKAADPDRVEPALKDYVLDVVSTSLALLYEVMTRNQTGFDAALLAALKGHKHYYGRGKQKHDILGQLALTPLALCVVARDGGMTIGVESDSIPRSVIEGGSPR